MFASSNTFILICLIVELRLFGNTLFENNQVILKICFACKSEKSKDDFLYVDTKF